MARIGGTCYFKIDGQQLSLTGGIDHLGSPLCKMHI